jgi:type IV pilus assembly protein PilA
MKNKGFSLVELIIVIAIMAILAAAIAPALIRYIDKSRRSDDVAAAETINTAVQSALANEDAYDEIQPAMSAMTGSATVLGSASAGTGSSSFGGTSASVFWSEVNSSTTGGPKLKYKKNGCTHWMVGVNSAGKPVVWVGTAGTTTTELQPSINASYK